jgi:chemotaxis protein MotA
MDISTLIGIIAGSALLLWAILTKSPLEPFMDAGSVAIVLGGASATVLIGFPLKHILGVGKVLKNCFFTKPQDPMKIIREMVENVTADIKDPFLVTGIQMAVDGSDPDLIEAILVSELESIEQRHSDGKAIFDNIGKYAPAFGMIGTLIGLIIMLGKMDDPKTIGPAMALALLTTLYGAVTANLIAMPMADKLGVRSREEIFIKMIMIKGVMAIQSGDNPRIVEQKLKTFLPNRMRDAGQEARAA